MSATASWSYTNTATVRPFVEVDLMSQESIYGAEYEIACTWAVDVVQERDAGGQGGAQGAERVVSRTIYTEDKRPKQLDLIRINGSTEWEEIRDRREFDMSFFGEEPDFVLVT